jgi:hypothetical protein
MDNIHILVEAALAIGGAFLGWTLKRVYHSIDELWRKYDEHNKRLTELSIELPKQYVTKDDLARAIDSIHERFDKLENKIDSI